MFAVNEAVDRSLLKPVAKGYQWVTPEFVDKGVSNFFVNLSEIKTAPNALLQLKFKKTGTSLLRFSVNSTVGLAGFFDVAQRFGLSASKEDLGQTFGHWGVKSGPYLMLPVLGPSNVRDALVLGPESWVMQRWLSPVNLLPQDYRTTTSISLSVVNAVDTRADLLAIESMLTGDRYVAIRELSIQLREYDVQDGNVEDAFLEFDDGDGEFIEEEDFLLDF